jgi:hypothetical protein
MMAESDSGREPGADDVRAAAAGCRRALEPALDGDWEVRAGTLEWTCRRTLDHMIDAQVMYAGHLATEARERLPRLRNGNPTLAVGDLLQSLAIAAAVLAQVIRGAGPTARGFHAAGLADGSGFAAMACTEMLVHTADIGEGLGTAFRPPDALAASVLARLFPWAPRDGSAWATLRWACGRSTLGDRERLAPDWYWHCAPLAEWDGTVKKRTAPPGWR